MNLSASNVSPALVKPLPDIIVIDTCVLISNVVRRLLLRLVDNGLFRPAWSPIIGDEWRRNAARLWDASPDDIQTQWGDLQVAYPDADQGDVSEFKEGLKRSDPKDWHVVAAARKVRERIGPASIAVVTRNIKDFNRAELRGLGLMLLDPDELLTRCWQQNADVVTSALLKIESDFEAVGRVSGPIDEVLKRERLFRLKRLLAIAAENTQQHEQVGENVVQVEVDRQGG
ncbi:PIN domain-containing protein [Pusillimonas minor]|uniref:PIN domain-containing protein n=1 Tax=Pusillimonas minor TaxID=2697024 RepID=UPI0032119AC1